MFVTQYLPWGAVAFAAGAGACWSVASWVSLHPRRRAPGFGGAGTTVQQFGDAMRRQSSWHAAACGLAGAAALLQALALALAFNLIG